MARDHTIIGDRYWECDICARTVRYGDTTIDDRGNRVCPRCLDDPAEGDNGN